MSYPVDDRVIEVAATGALSYNYDFEVEDVTTDLTVFITPSAGGAPVEYTYTATNPPPAGANEYHAIATSQHIVINTADDNSGDTIRIVGHGKINRQTTFQTGGDYSSSEVNAEFDQVENRLEENARDLLRTIRLNPGSTDTISLVLPEPITSDGILKINAAGTGIELLAGGAGDVTGPTTSTDTAVPRWSGTSGLILLDSGVLIDSSDNITGVVDLTTTGNTLLGGTLGVTGLTTLGPGGLVVSAGDIKVGDDGDWPGHIFLYANGTHAGGTLDFYIHGNADTNYEYFRFRAGDQLNTVDEDFYLGTDVTKDLFKFDRLGNITVTAGITGASLDLASGASVTSIDITTAADSDTALVTSQGINEAITTAVSAIDHESLSGLADNDHPQYALLTGPTFTGNVTVEKASPSLILYDTDGSGNCTVAYANGVGAAMGPNVSGDSFILTSGTAGGGSGAVNLTLSGDTGSELATFAGDVVATGAEVTLHSLAGGYGYVTQKDLTGALEFGLRMQSTGQTILNSSSGAGLVLSNNAVSMLSFDSSQNATFANDVEVGGDLTLGLSGVNKTWSHYIDAMGFGNVNANTLVEGEAFAGGDTYLNYYGFPEDNNHGIGGSFSLPSDYDGSSLSFTIYWTAGTGASVGETVRWAINVGAFEDGDDLTVVNSGPNTPTPTLTGVDELQMTVMTSFTPTNAVEGKDFITIYVRRLGGIYDTLAVDAKLFGVRIEYA